MYEAGLTARKVAEFDTAIFDEYRAWEAKFDWDPIDNPNRFIRRAPPGKRPDNTYLIYLPTDATRTSGFAREISAYPLEIDSLWNDTLKPQCEYLMSLTGIEDPIIVQADIARMRPLDGDTLLHTDTRYQHRYSRRYNIAISTNTECWLYHNSYDLNTGGTRDHISEGEMWELNNKIPHTAVNYGNTWRTHLIIDIMPRNYYNRMNELYDLYAKVPNPQGKNTTYDYDIEGNLIHEPLFEDLPHCFPARTHI